MARAMAPTKTGVVVMPPWLFKAPSEIKIDTALNHLSTEYVMLLSWTVDYE